MEKCIDLRPKSLFLRSQVCFIEIEKKKKGKYEEN